MAQRLGISTFSAPERRAAHLGRAVDPEVPERDPAHPRRPRDEPARADQRLRGGRERRAVQRPVADQVDHHEQRRARSACRAPPDVRSSARRSRGRPSTSSPVTRSTPARRRCRSRAGTPRTPARRSPARPARRRAYSPRTHKADKNGALWFVGMTPKYVATNALINLDNPSSPASGLPGITDAADTAFGGVAAKFWIAAMQAQLSHDKDLRAGWTWPSPDTVNGDPVPTVIGLSPQDARRQLKHDGYRMVLLGGQAGIECDNTDHLPVGEIAYYGPTHRPARRDDHRVPVLRRAAGPVRLRPAAAAADAAPGPRRRQQQRHARRWQQQRWRRRQQPAPRGRRQRHRRSPVAVRRPGGAGGGAGDRWRRSRWRRSRWTAAGTSDPASSAGGVPRR